MRLSGPIGFLTLWVSILPVAAQSIELYRPVGDQYQAWNCKDLGTTGGAVGLSERKLVDVDLECSLSNPVGIRGMNATLYDATCVSAEETYRERIMVMPSLKGTYIVRDMFVTQWQRCDAE